MKNTFRRIIANLSQNIGQFLHSKQLLIFIGDIGTYVAAYNGSVAVDSMFVKNHEYDDKESKKFFDKYKKYMPLIIFDRSESELHHSQIIVAQSLLRADHVGKFISKTFDKNDIVAGSVFDVTNDSSETWHTVLTSIKEIPNLTKLTSLISFSLKNFRGIFFYVLNVPNLIKQIKLSSGTQIKSKLRIFVTITSFSGIRLVICREQNVMESHITAFPYDKSSEYVQGAIEQIVSDAIISLKNHIHHYQERPSVIFLVNKELQTLLQNSKFDSDEVVIIPTESKNVFSDHALSYFLNKNVEHKATNHEIKSFDRAKWFNQFAFKPLWLLLAVFAFFLCKNELKIYKNYDKAQKMNELYYNISEEYRAQRTKYPYIDRFNGIVDFYNAMKFLEIRQELPFDVLDRSLTLIPDGLKIYSIDWDKSEVTSSIKVGAKYLKETSDVSAVLTSLESDISVMQRSLSDYKIEYTKNNNTILNHSGFITVEVQLIITKKEK